jgi:hypothetical protein
MAAAGRVVRIFFIAFKGPPCFPNNGCELATTDSEGTVFLAYRSESIRLPVHSRLIVHRVNRIP